MLEIGRFVDNEGQKFSIDLSLIGRPDDGFDDIRILEHVHVLGEAFAQLAVLYIDGHLTATIRQPCRRCLDAVTRMVELHEEFEIPIPPGVERVDLWPTVSRLVLSSVEPHVLCHPSCRGLCPVCGANLNREPSHVCPTDHEEGRTLRDLLPWTNDS